MAGTFSIHIADVRKAAAAIGAALVRTPTRHSRTLSAIAGCNIWLKFENRQFTASFKERGALNFLLALSDTEKRRGVCAMSAGNHAQGVAYHAGRLGIPATIVMPLSTPFNKIKHTRDFGATVLVEGHDLDAARAAALALAAREGLTFIHPYDDALVIAGQGTVALEMLEDVPQLDAVVVPVGGGGLISGMAVAAKAIKPGIEIFGVQTALYPAMRDAVAANSEMRPATPIPSAQTIAEGIAVKMPGRLTTPIVKALVKDILIVDEAQIEHALAMILEIEKTVTEGAAAASFAAVLANRALFQDREIGIVMSGANIDMRLLSNVILRELTREGRILSLDVAIEDRPGALARVAALVGEAGGNILEISHNRMMMGISAKSATLGIVIEARDAEHADAIRAALVAGGFPAGRVTLICWSFAEERAAGFAVSNAATHQTGSAMTDKNDPQDHVWTLIKPIHATVLITKDGDRMDARPMATTARQEEGRIYILANKREDSDREIQSDSQVVLSFQDGATHVIVYGSATASNDRAKIADLWNAFDKAWWDGPEDPRIRLLTIIPDSAEYWESPGKVVAYAKMLAAAATNTRPDIGENRKVAL